MKSSELRSLFLDYFVKNGHTKVSSSSLIPAQDPSLLFANAGMNQFKDIFLGKEKRNYTRATSCQKCVRATDLENVGYTARHLTFFEMLGNFSFGDYFKKEAMEYAWGFLTKVVHMDPEKLYVSVYKNDDEAYELWNKHIGVPTNHIVRLGEADNFWQMGDTGPCGPCTEIYVDRGSHRGCKQSSCAPGCSCDRFLEVWNLVFMQFDRQPDGTDLSLKQKGVDTGMGLERLTAIMQEKDNVFETDIFAPLIAAIEEKSGKKYAGSDAQTKTAFQAIADHIRSSSFVIADGATPSNEGRGYVLRKIIRRAIMFNQKLCDTIIFVDLVDTLIEQMGASYPELITQKAHIKKLLQTEIDRFENSLSQGRVIFERMHEEALANKSKVITGEQAFKLYDTFGFPLELTKVLAQDVGLTVDIKGFEAAMEQQRKQSAKKETAGSAVKLDPALKTNFVGYETTTSEATISAIIVKGTLVEQAPANEQCIIITDVTPFYVECGGQTSDMGFVELEGARCPIIKLHKFDHAIGLEIKAAAPISINQKVTLHVDEQTRLNTMKNHTATHLLQAALVEVLGASVKQAGSLVTSEYLRFDFNTTENVTPEQLELLERRVNAKIMENIPLNIRTTTYKDAIEHGVTAIFGEKYNPESVRVVTVPGFSAELCGGTHATATGDIGCFKITEYSAVSAGVKRIVALTGPEALTLFQLTHAVVKNLGQEFKVKPAEVLDAVKKQRDQLKEAGTQIKQLKKKLWNVAAEQWLTQAKTINGLPVLYCELDDATGEDLKDVCTLLLSKKPGFYFLTAPGAQRTGFYAQIAKEFANKLNGVALLTWLKTQGFNGGGSATMIQGSTTQSTQGFGEKLESELRTIIK